MCFAGFGFKILEIAAVLVLFLTKNKKQYSFFVSFRYIKTKKI
jgi:hypothetical protein